jgi:hypothetical protein
MKEQIIELLKNRESGKVGNIEIRSDEISRYYTGGESPLNSIPEEIYIEYDFIADYIIDANK